MAKLRTHYDNLNVSRDAPANVIRAAYKVLCQKYHPDKYTGGAEEAIRIMKVINGAYAVLSDTGKRLQYDHWITQQERRQASDDARRMMQVIANSYAAPLAQMKKKSLVLVAIDQCRKQAGLIWDSCFQVFRKIRWILLLTGIVLIAAFFYPFDLPTTTAATVVVNQQAIAQLQKAKQWLNQGQAAKALPLYVQLAQQGHAEAQFQLAMMYADGRGIAKDYELAASWFDKAAKQGHIEAQTKLGFMYATGTGVAQNDSSAVYWCYQAAEQGNAIAQYNLGLMYVAGQGVAQDNKLAMSWYTKAAAQGEAYAQYHLAEMYAKGVGVAIDDNKALGLYQKAAKQGVAEAIVALKRYPR
jgi:hypothetical protein